MRFYLVDRITQLHAGGTASGIKCWSLDNSIFQDHFPGIPMVPGVLLTESMAQLAGILIKKTYYLEYGEGEEIYPVLSIIQKAKFRSFVKPGDQCILFAEVISVDHNRASAKVHSTVEGELVSEAQLTFLIGKAEDMGDNPFIRQMDQYYHSILPK